MLKIDYFSILNLKILVMSRCRLYNLLTLFFLIVQAAFASGQMPESGRKNILFINSYHQGFEWSDSVCSGVIHITKSNPKYNLFIENLQSKQFGQSHFEIVKQYISQKYSAIAIDGVLVSDNDALDFAIQNEKSLFPGLPIVFAGISNTEQYSLEGSKIYGFKETAPVDSFLFLIKKVLPDTKKLLVLADNTTTGEIYRKFILNQKSIFKDLQIIMPEVIDIDSIYQMVASADYDAIYYVGISQDKDGKLFDYIDVRDQIALKANIPLFSSSPSAAMKGVFGGLYQSGTRQGEAAAQLLIQLLNTSDYSSLSHVNKTKMRCFYDESVVDRYGVSVKLFPENALVFNANKEFNRSYIQILIIILVLLSFLVVILTAINRKRKIAHQKSAKQLIETEEKKNQLKEASMKLSMANKELETMNDKLNQTNAELLDAKKKAEESDSLKSAFLANVSHEIRTPLNSIVGFSSLLCESDLEDDVRQEYYNIVLSNTDSLLVLIDEIIDLSKIEAHQLSINKQDFSIDQLMSELFQSFGRYNKNENLEFKTSEKIENKELIVYSDRVRVNQIFVNLLSNAFKFTESGMIEFGYYKSEGNETVIYVKDTGIGIASEYHQAIFHRFRKLNENSGKVFRGTGLGLAITQKLVDLLGGKIWLESEPGKGSTFCFTLDGLSLNDM
jgi:signal transduction histidine kinase